MFISLVTPFEMMQNDRSAVKYYGLPEEILMENAGREACSSLVQSYGDVKSKIVFVFCGSGNNGGDGIVTARYLKEAEAQVLVILEKTPQHFSKVSYWHYQIAKRYGVQFISIQEFYSDLAFSITPDIVIDALLGIGFNAPVRENLQERIQYINSLRRKSYIVSLDTPSGLHCYTGTPSPIAVQADITITFHLPKVGLYMPKASPYTGKLIICNIGIPKQSIPYKYQALHHAPITPIISTELHKHKAGKILVIGGSEEYIGAPLLSAKASYKMGAGSVTIATLQSVATRIQSMDPENIVISLPHNKWSAVAFSSIQNILYNYDAVIVGPGMGSYIGVKDFVLAMLQYRERPLTIFDADAVRTISLRNNDMVTLLEPTDILTPHIGELAQMLSISTENILNNKLDIAHICKQKTRAVIILKDAGSIIIQQKEPITLSPFLAPNLAIAGSGDILSGMIAAESLKEKIPFLATCSAVYYHAYIGKELQKEFPLRGNTASDILNYIPHVLKKIHTQTSLH